MTSAESDWKIFKKLRVIALERFSQGILDQSQAVCSKPSRTAHERYADLYDLIQMQNREMASMFDDSRRSTAVRRLQLMAMHKLLTDEELSEFGPEMRGAAGIEP